MKTTIAIGLGLAIALQSAQAAPRDPQDEREAESRAMLADTWVGELKQIQIVGVALKCGLADKQTALTAVIDIQSTMFQQLRRADIGNDAQRDKFYNLITTGADKAIAEGKAGECRVTDLAERGRLRAYVQHMAYPEVR